MNVADILHNYLNNTEEAGIYIDSLSLNELPFYLMEEEEINKVNKVDLFTKIDQDIIFITEEGKVMDFFEELFTSPEIIDYFNVKFRCYVDLTKQGDVELNDNANVKNLNPELIYLALEQLIGEKELEEVISFYASMNFSVLITLQNRLQFEIENRLVVHFKPLAERSAKLYEEFELTMTQ